MVDSIFGSMTNSYFRTTKCGTARTQTPAPQPPLRKLLRGRQVRPRSQVRFTIRLIRFRVPLHRPVGRPMAPGYRRPRNQFSLSSNAMNPSRSGNGNLHGLSGIGKQPRLWNPRQAQSQRRQQAPPCIHSRLRATSPHLRAIARLVSSAYSSRHSSAVILPTGLPVKINTPISRTSR